METLETFGTHEKNFRFSCDICEYKTNKKSSYENHKLSAKHKNYAKLAQRAEKLCPNHKCSKCDKTFTNRSGLWKHKKKCLSYQQNMDNNLTDIMMKVIEHNQKLENKIICGAISGSSKEESEINYEKIIRNIVRETAIDK